MKIIWSKKAKIDLNENIKYITKKSPKNGLMVLNTLTELTNSLHTFPNAYPIEPIYNDKKIRFIAKWNFKIIYYIDKKNIYVMRIFNTHQHPNKIKD